MSALGGTPCLASTSSRLPLSQTTSVQVLFMSLPALLERPPNEHGMAAQSCRESSVLGGSIRTLMSCRQFNSPDIATFGSLLNRATQYTFACSGGADSPWCQCWVTLSQQRMAQWTLEDTPCTLSLYSAAKLWHMKMHNL